jgi:protein TonB
MDAWRAKVERIGNLNYPEEARQRRLSGSLLLDVALRPDGSVADITIRRPSGYKELDAAAVRIVKLSAPFAPFPEHIRREVDLLHITRSWQFMHTSKLTTNG